MELLSNSGEQKASFIQEKETTPTVSLNNVGEIQGLSIAGPQVNLERKEILLNGMEATNLAQEACEQLDLTLKDGVS